MATSVTLYALGVGDFGATKLFHISLLLRVDGRPYVIDCPHRFVDMLLFNAKHGECVVTPDDYQDILLTHLHIDHAGGIVDLIASGMVSDYQPRTLYAPAQTLAYLWSDQNERGVVSAAKIEGGSVTLDRYFRPVPLSNPHHFGDFTLHYRATQHFPNTFAYILDFANYKLGFSADTAHDEALIRWLDPCDLILHDVTWPPWWDDEEMQKLHPPLAKLLEAPPAFQQKTLLCHYDENSYLQQEIGNYSFLEQNRLYRLVG